MHAQIGLGPISRTNDLPSIQLRSAQYDDPVITTRVILHNLAQNIATEWTGTEHNHYFNGYERRIRNAETHIRPSVLLPW